MRAHVRLSDYRYLNAWCVRAPEPAFIIQCANATGIACLVVFGREGALGRQSQRLQDKHFEQKNRFRSKKQTTIFLHLHVTCAPSLMSKRTCRTCKSRFAVTASFADTTECKACRPRTRRPPALGVTVSRAALPARPPPRNMSTNDALHALGDVRSALGSGVRTGGGTAAERPPPRNWSANDLQEAEASGARVAADWVPERVVTSPLHKSCGAAEPLSPMSPMQLAAAPVPPSAAREAVAI